MSERVEVVVTELQSEIDPLALEMYEAEQAAGLDPDPPTAKVYSAAVERDGKREVWEVSKEDAERITSATERQPGAEPVTIDLPEPTQAAPADCEARLVLTPAKHNVEVSPDDLVALDNAATFLEVGPEGLLDTGEVREITRQLRSLGDRLKRFATT